jgi:hypothetical protein
MLKHHFPTLALDIDSVRRTCETLTSSIPEPVQYEATVEVLRPSVNAQPSESPGIEDEDCTIDYVDGSTARMLQTLDLVHAPPAVLIKLSFALPITQANFLTGTFPYTSNVT